MDQRARPARVEENVPEPAVAAPPTPRTSVALVSAMQRSAGNRATLRALGRQTLAREPDATIEEKWLGAIAFQKYRDAAQTLNGFSDDDIGRHVRALRTEPELEAIMANADVNGGAADRIRIPLRSELGDRRYLRAASKHDWPEAAKQLNEMTVDAITLRLEAIAHDDPDALIAIKDAAAAATLGTVMLVISPIVARNEPRRIEVWNRHYTEAINKGDFARAATLLAAASADDLKDKAAKLSASQLEGIEFAARRQGNQYVSDAIAKARPQAPQGGEAAVGALADLLKRAGLTDAQIAAAHAEVGPQGARSMLSDLERLTPTLGAFGPRMSAIRILREILAGGATAQITELATTRIDKLRNLVVMRPDGYIVRAATGEPIQKIPGEPSVADGAIKFGPFAVGAFYYLGALFFATNDQLDKTGPSIAELHLEHNLADKALDGVESSIKGLVEGLFKFIKNPIQALKDLVNLPSALKLLIENSPGYWERFKNMTLGDQVEQVANLLTTLIGMYGGATAAMRVPGLVAKAGGAALAATDGAMAELAVNVLRLTNDGRLVMAQATVKAGVAAPAIPGGPFGAAFLLSQANQAAGGGGDKLLDPKSVDDALSDLGKGDDAPREPLPGVPTPLDFHSALTEAWRLLRAEGPVTNNPSNLGTRLHAAIAKVFKGKPVPADWTMKIEQPLGEVGGAGAHSVREWLTARGNPHGLLDELPKKVLDTQVRNLKPDLVMSEGSSRTLVWDLTSSSKAEHVAKTTLYAEILGRDGVLTRVMETYWSAGAL